MHSPQLGQQMQMCRHRPDAGHPMLLAPHVRRHVRPLLGPELPARRQRGLCSCAEAGLCLQRAGLQAAPHQKRERARTASFAQIFMRYTSGSGWASVGRSRPTTWY